jgi:cobalt-zinc-cadmium efflux system membrane fusion protein
MSETTSSASHIESAVEHGQVLQQSSTTPARRWLTRLARVLPSALVFLALAGLAWWGNQTGWTLPRLADLTGAIPEKEDWCEEHAVPESACIECNPGLWPRPMAYGWCSRHGVHDCPFEHPDVAQLGDVNRAALAQLNEQAERTLGFAERKGNNRRCKLHPRRVQIASQQALDRMGIDSIPVRTEVMEEVVAAPGEIIFDPEGVTSLSVPVSGRVWRLEGRGNVGQAVRQGDVLALVDAAEVGKAKAEYLQALGQVDLKAQNLERLRKGYQEGVTPEARFFEASAAVREAQVRLVAAQQALANLGLPVSADSVKGLALEEVARRLQGLGLPEGTLQDLGSGSVTANLLPVRVPFDGVVIARRAALGAMADPTRALFVVADPKRLWLALNIPQDSLKPFREKDPQRLLYGRTVHFVPDGSTEDVTANILWVSTYVDEKTRTLQVRAELKNPDGRLRANTFGSGRIVLRREEQALVVPSEAVHWEGKCHVVFVQDKDWSQKGAPKVFHVRTVQPGVQDGGNTEIIAGLLPGEMVAYRNSGILRAELLKSSLGEG